MRREREALALWGDVQDPQPLCLPGLHVISSVTPMCGACLESLSSHNGHLNLSG